MSGAPETKYTDRDVRENVTLVEAAMMWLEAYQGEFDYLIDMKMRLASGYELTTPMVRGVLNCMRHDPRVTGLPAPLPPIQETVVVSMARKRQRRRGVLDGPCDKTTEHSSHIWTARDEEGEEDGMYRCEGIPYAINRTSRYFSAKIKVPYVVAKSGGLIHRVAEEGHDCHWMSPPHAWGFYDDTRRLDGIPAPELIVNLVCRYPSVLRNPFLIREEDVQHLLAVGVTHCRHCGLEMEGTSGPS